MNKLPFFKKLNRQQIILILIVVAIFLSLQLVKNRQNLQKKAGGTPPTIAINILAANYTLKQGQRHNSLSINLTNTSNVVKLIYLAGIEFKFDPLKFRIEVLCNPTRSILPFRVVNKIVNNVASLTCSKTDGNNVLMIAPNQNVTIGYIDLEVLENAELGQTKFVFGRTVIPDKETGLDTAIFPNDVTFDIISKNDPDPPILTPNPTIEPLPTVVENTPTPCIPYVISDQPLGGGQTSLTNQWSQYDNFYGGYTTTKLIKVSVKAGNYGRAQRQITCRISDIYDNNISPEASSKPFTIDSGSAWRDIDFSTLNYQLTRGQYYRIYCKGPDSWNSIYWESYKERDINMYTYKISICQPF